MRQTFDTKQYRKSIRHCMLSGIFPLNEVKDIIRTIASDIPLPVRYRNHKLRGNMKGRYECHIRPDLLLVYELSKDSVLILHDIGSHAEIFG